MPPASVLASARLVGFKVDVIVATNDVVIAAVKRETRTIPIVMTNSTDPVGTGLVASLARPGEMSPGSTPCLRSSVGSGWNCCGKPSPIPGLSRVAFFWNPHVRGNVLDYKESRGRS
jgi:putative ABC transport system substrate-binding protein